MELFLVREIKGNKKGFFNYTESKRKTMENVSLLLNVVSTLVMEDAEKMELPNTFFVSVSTVKTVSLKSRTLEI